MFFFFLPKSSAIWKLFATQQIKCFSFVTLRMPYNRHIGIYDMNKSTEMSEWVVTSMQIWTKCLLKSIWFEIEMIFQYCDATFVDTKRRQVLYVPLRKISIFWIAMARFLCFINFICISKNHKTDTMHVYSQNIFCRFGYATFWTRNVTSLLVLVLGLFSYYYYSDPHIRSMCIKRYILCIEFNQSSDVRHFQILLVKKTR